MNNPPTNVLLQDFALIKKHFANSPEFTVADIRQLFPQTNPKTVNWKIFKLTQRDLLTRQAQGTYSLKKTGRDEISSPEYDYLSNRGRKVYGILQNFGYEYYISGLDGLSEDLLHLPENFPVIAVTEKSGLTELQEELISNQFTVMTQKDYSSKFDRIFSNNFDVILLQGKNFELAKQGIAVKEKAFIDLYYAVTRMNYAFSVQELERIFDTLIRKKAIMSFRIKEAAKDLSISNEIEYIMNIFKLPEAARSFVKIRLEKSEI